MCSCPFVQRAKITLKEKQLPYETIYIDAKNKSQDFLDLFRHVTSNSNHRGTVPVIVGRKGGEEEEGEGEEDLKQPFTALLKVCASFMTVHCAFFEE